MNEKQFKRFLLMLEAIRIATATDDGTGILVPHRASRSDTAALKALGDLNNNE